MDQVPHLKHKPFDASLEKPYRAWMAAVKDGVQFLRADKNVDKDRIGVVGLSMGGFVGTSLVVDHPELKIKGLINAFGGLPPVQHDKVQGEVEAAADVNHWSGG